MTVFMEKNRTFLKLKYDISCKNILDVFLFLNYGDRQVPRKHFFSHSKTLLFIAKLTFSRQNFFSRGKTYFLTKNFLSHGKTYFLTAKLSFSRQKFLSHCKTFFSK